MNATTKFDTELLIDDGESLILHEDVKPLVVATGTTKVKKTARSFRIWIEGNKLLEAGFSPDVQFSVRFQQEKNNFDTHGRYYPARICLALDSEGDRRVTKASRNGKARPIIDLHQALIGELFAEGTELEVSYIRTGFILISKVQS